MDLVVTEARRNLPTWAVRADFDALGVCHGRTLGYSDDTFVNVVPASAGKRSPVLQELFLLEQRARVDEALVELGRFLPEPERQGHELGRI